MCKFDKKNGDKRIDPCMRELVKNLKYWTDLDILACCCGHNKYPMSIIVNVSKIGLCPIDFVSNKVIPRKRKFYKRDKDGYYYIPEVVN